MSAADVIAESVRDHLEDLDVMCPLWHRDYEAGDVPCDAHQRVIDSLVQPLTEAVAAALSAAGYVVATPEDIRAWPVEQVAELIGGDVREYLARRIYEKPPLNGHDGSHVHVVGPWVEVRDDV